MTFPAHFIHISTSSENPNCVETQLFLELRGNKTEVPVCYGSCYEWRQENVIKLLKLKLPDLKDFRQGTVKY